jgi:hypothetical protein
MVSFAVMAVPERVQGVRAILPQLPSSTRVFIDSGYEGVWFNARRAWTWLVTQRSEWVCLLQDDLILAVGFALALDRATSAVPDGCEVVAPYGSRKVLASTNGSWYRIRDGVWGQAICMRRTALAEFLRWERANIRPEFKWDDSRVSIWMIETGRCSWVMIPSIVDHDGDKRSVLGNHAPRPRRATLFISDASETEWPADEGLPPYSTGSSMTDYRRKFLL